MPEGCNLLASSQGSQWPPALATARKALSVSVYSPIQSRVYCSRARIGSRGLSSTSLHSCSLARRLSIAPGTRDPPPASPPWGF